MPTVAAAVVWPRRRAAASLLPLACSLYGHSRLLGSRRITDTTLHTVRVIYLNPTYICYLSCLPFTPLARSSDRKVFYQRGGATHLPERLADAGLARASLEQPLSRAVGCRSRSQAGWSGRPSAAWRQRRAGAGCELYRRVATLEEFSTVDSSQILGIGRLSALAGSRRRCQWARGSRRRIPLVYHGDAEE